MLVVLLACVDGKLFSVAASGIWVLFLNILWVA